MCLVSHLHFRKVTLGILWQMDLNEALLEDGRPGLRLLQRSKRNGAKLEQSIRTRVYGERSEKQTKEDGFKFLTCLIKETWNRFVRENDQHFIMSFLDSKFLENKASAFVPWSVQPVIHVSNIGCILQIRTCCIVCECVFVGLLSVCSRHSL